MLLRSANLQLIVQSNDSDLDGCEAIDVYSEPIRPSSARPAREATASADFPDIKFCKSANK